MGLEAFGGEVARFPFPLNKHVGLVIAVETPMVLIEAADRHEATIIDLHCLHVQVLEGFFSHGGSILAQSLEQVRVQVGLVAGLVPVSRCHNVH